MRLIHALLMYTQVTLIFTKYEGNPTPTFMMVQDTVSFREIHERFLSHYVVQRR